MSDVIDFALITIATAISTWCLVRAVKHGDESTPLAMGWNLTTVVLWTKIMITG